MKVLLLLLFLLFNHCSGKSQHRVFNWSDTAFTKGDYRMVKIKTPLEGVNPENTEYLNQDIFDTIFSFLKENHKTTIKVNVHSATIGSDTFNLKVTQLHANNIKSVLIKRGVSEGRIIAKGYGESHPIVPEDKLVNLPDKERLRIDSKNSRVVLVILNP